MYGVVVGKIGSLEENTFGDNYVVKISVVEDIYLKGEKTATWYSCSYWGNRAKATFPHLFKGQSVSLSGQSYNEKYNDKYYLKMKVDNIVLQSWPDKEGGNSSNSESRDNTSALNEDSGWA